MEKGLLFADYKTHACLIAFDLFGNEEMDTLDPIEFVPIQVSIKFTNPVLAPYNVMTYHKRDNFATVNVEGRWLLS